MGTRRISSEVVQTILDGLHSIISDHEKDTEQMFPLVLETVKTCKELIEVGETQPKPELWDRAFLRVGEGLNCDTSMSLDFLSGVLSPPLSRIPEQGLAPYPSLPDQSFATIGFMHMTLQEYLDLGLLNGSLQAFQNLLGIADGSRASAVEDFVQKSPIEQEEQGHLLLSEFPECEDFRHTALAQLPDRTLATFLDFLSKLRLYRLGRWLLSSQGIDGPIISQERYTSESLQPALLQFAAATSDVLLLSNIASKLPTPLSEKNTIALLQCQIVPRQWDRVKDILYNARAEGHVLPLTVISSIAQAIVIDEHNQLNNAQEDSLAQAEQILVDLIAGKYELEPIHSKSPSYLRRRKVNQISRIITSLPGRQNTSISKLVKLFGQDHATAIVDPKAFDIILDGVVQAFGPSAGKEFWQRWCIPPGTKRKQPYIQDGQEKVVKPTVQTLNFILAPLAPREEKLFDRNSLENDSSITTKGHDVACNSSTKFSSEASAILPWAARVLRNFGLQEGTIAAELEIYRPIICN